MKKICSIVLFVFLLSFLLSFSVHAEDYSRTITNTSTHILGDAGIEIDTKAIRVEGTFGQTTLDQTTLTTQDPEVVIADDSITVSQKGTYTVTMNYQSVTYTLKLFIKNTNETEYVLYDESFAYPDGNIPSELTKFNNYGTSGGSASIQNEQLLLNRETIVLFPSYLQGFTNYIIEADMKMTSADNTGRWTSIMYRYQKENYYQMAVRQDATLANGVEFAKKTNGSWNVAKTASYTEALSPTTTYKLKVDIKDSTVKQYINNTLMTTYESAFDYTYGHIGLQADKATVYYDNVKITLPETYVEYEGHEFQQVPYIFHPSESVIAPATTIVWFNHASEMTQLTSQVRPATVIFRLNSDLDVVDEKGAFYKSLYDTLLEIEGKLIPGFYVEDEGIARDLAYQLKRYSIIDTFIFSKDEDVILAARDEHSLMRGVMIFDFVDKTELTEDDLLDVRRKTNRAEAISAVLPVDLVSKHDVEYLQQRLMTIWIQTTDQSISQYKAILSGAQGIITQQYTSLYAKYSMFPENTQVRRTMMIAHRGLYNGAQSSAPENSIEAALASIAKGADILELDVHRTLDNQVIVMHDASTSRTAVNYQALTINASTLAQIKEVKLADYIGGRLDIEIPTLIEYFEAVKDSGKIIFIEIKPNDPLLVELVADIIEEYDMYAQSVMITFGVQNILDMSEVYPDLSNGYLTQSILNASSIPANVGTLLTTVVPIKSTFNTNYTGLTEDLMRQVIHRGVTVWPWTIDNYIDLNTYYTSGVGGITTNYVGYYENTMNRFVVKDYPSQVTWEDRLSIKIETEISSPNGTIDSSLPVLVMADDGGTGASFDANGQLVSINQSGTMYLYGTYESSMPDGTKITLLTDLIEIEVLAEVIEEEEKPESTPLALILGVSGGVLAIGSGAVIWLIIKKKKVI